MRGKPGDLPAMAFQDLGGRRPKPRCPKRDAPAFAGAGNAPIWQKGQRIDAAAMPARHCACLARACVPQDDSVIKAGGDNMLPIGQGKNRAHGAPCPDKSCASAGAASSRNTQKSRRITSPPRR